MSVRDQIKQLSDTVGDLQSEIAMRKRLEREVAELCGRLSKVRESERLFLAQELHDGPIQDLCALLCKLSTLPKDSRFPGLECVQDGLMQLVDTLRTLCEDLRPSTLISLGLECAIHSHIERFKKQYPMHHFQIEVQPTGTRLAEQTRLALYRIYQQAIANAVRHAQASQIFVCFLLNHDYALLEVRDDGRGFIVPADWIEFARQGHLGLIGGIERAKAVGGEMTVHSAPGEGTRIQVRVPLEPNISSWRS